MPKVTISYRRSDSEAFTGRIFDRLIAHYGKDDNAKAAQAKPAVEEEPSFTPSR